MVKNPPANAGDATQTFSIPGLGSCPGVQNGNPLQYSCLENSKDRGAWWATVNGLQRARHNWGTEQARNILLKWVSCGQYIGRWYFFICQSLSFNWWVCFIFKLIINKEGPASSILLFVCYMSCLFLSLHLSDLAFFCVWFLVYYCYSLLIAFSVYFLVIFLMVNLRITIIILN